MNELMLSSIPRGEEEDDHALPFPEGTPFKGVVRSKDFINGLALAQRIGLTVGSPINNNSGWLHFVEENGYNIYIAKKPLRYGLSWVQVDAAQVGKEITIGDKTFLVEFMTGMKRPANNGIANADAGGQWNRYMYNVYGGELENLLPSTRLKWGSYTERMLGIARKDDTVLPFGGYSHVKESVTNSATAHGTRGSLGGNGGTLPHIMGVWWGDASYTQTHYGWRPMLVEKGTTPPVVITPFKGEVAQADFITTDALRTAVGQVSGTANSTEPWLRIEENGKVYYTPKKPLSRNMTREQLNAEGVVTGDKTVIIKDKHYKVRLMTGRPGSDGNTAGGEYYHWFKSLTDGTWAWYLESDFALGSGTAVPASFIHTTGTEGRGHAICGYPGPFGAWYQPVGAAADPLYGWRPVLEEFEYVPPVIPDNGPGPEALIAGNENAGYFGMVNTADFFTAEQIDATSATPITGTPVNRSVTDLWHKYVYKGNILFIPKVPIRNGMTWNNLYLHGLVYGTDNTGVTQSGGSPNGFDVVPLTPTNQLRTITKTSPDGTVFLFKVRLLRCVANDPESDYSATVPATLLKNRATEFSQLVDRTIPAPGADSVWATTGQITSVCTQETWGYAQGGQAYIIQPSPGEQWGNRKQQIKAPAAGYSWLPAVELIEVIKP